MSLKTIAWTTALFASLTLAQDVLDISLEEIDRNCRDWAERDQVEESELAEYLTECRRLEAESYGLVDIEDVEDYPDSEVPEDP